MAARLAYKAGIPQASAGAVYISPPPFPARTLYQGLSYSARKETVYLKNKPLKAVYPKIRRGLKNSPLKPSNQKENTHEQTETEHL